MPQQTESKSSLNQKPEECCNSSETYQHNQPSNASGMQVSAISKSGDGLVGAIEASMVQEGLRAAGKAADVAPADAKHLPQASYAASPASSVAKDMPISQASLHPSSMHQAAHLPTALAYALSRPYICARLAYE